MQQQHNNSQNASSSQSNIPGSYEHSQVTPSGAYNDQASCPMLGADSRLVPSASISDRNDVDISTGVQKGRHSDYVTKVAGSVDKKDHVTSQSTNRDYARLGETGAQAQAVDPGLENTQVNQSELSFPQSTASVTDCIAPTDNLFKSGSEPKLDIVDETLEENEDEQTGDDTQGRSISSATSSSQDERRLAGSLHFSGVKGLASSHVPPAASLGSLSLQLYAQRTTDGDQVFEELSSENAPVIDHNAGWPVGFFQQPEFDQDNAAQGHFDDEHADHSLHDAQPANAIQQPEILEFDRNDDIDLAQARAERNHNAPARASRRRQYFMNADGVIDIFLARQEWILGHLCLSCRENNKEVMMLPCGHSVLCWPCFLEASRFPEQINRCPRCMQPTSEIKLSEDCSRRVLQLSQYE